MAKNVYSVRQVNAYIKNMFVQDFMLNRIYVKGEVSNCKYHTSGHIYFSLKDESGAIACVMFAGERRTGLTFRMQEGQKVIVLGSVIRGETPHFEYICSAVAQGIGSLNVRAGEQGLPPVIFGVLTDNHIDQSRARSGGRLGNKGVECAVDAIRMGHLYRNWNHKPIK